MILPSLKIGNRLIGPGQPVFIIAEISANHNQDIDQAIQLIRAAKKAGADAVKSQAYTPDTLTIRSTKKYFQISGGTLWDGTTLYDLYSKAYTPWEWLPKLKAAAEDLGMTFFASAFDATAVDFLEKLKVPTHKLASFEIVDIPLIEKMAATGKPIIMSTGMATSEEIQAAVDAVRRLGNERIALLKCTSAYPAPPESMNLKTLSHLAGSFKVPVGLSDHTLGTVIPVAAVALGACIIEKHFTLTRAVPGPDSAFSLEPAEFETMVRSIRDCEKSLGSVQLGLTREEEKSRIFRRSLFAVQDIKKGEVLTADSIRSIRPGHGLPPRHFRELLGRRAVQDIERGTPLAWDMIDPVK